MLKFLRFIKGESSEVSRLRADTYDEFKELDVIEYTDTVNGYLPVDATKQRWAYFPSGYKTLNGTISEDIITEWIPDAQNGFENKPVGTIVMRGRKSKSLMIGIWDTGSEAYKGASKILDQSGKPYAHELLPVMVNYDINYTYESYSTTPANVSGFYFYGTPASGKKLTIPKVKRIYSYATEYSSGSDYSVTTGSGTSATIKAGTYGSFYCDGTNVILVSSFASDAKFSSEVQITSANAVRMVQGSYGAFLRNNGDALLILLTASGDQYGSWNALRPFYVALSSGEVFMNCGVRMNGRSFGAIEFGVHNGGPAYSDDLTFVSPNGTTRSIRVANDGGLELINAAYTDAVTYFKNDGTLYARNIWAYGSVEAQNGVWYIKDSVSHMVYMFANASNSGLYSNTYGAIIERSRGYYLFYGAAQSAEKLLTARKINGVSFDGTADIQVPFTSSYWKNLPIGFEYVQRKGQAAPSTLFGGGTWSNVSSEYAGLFERIEGGNAAAYGSTQDDAIRDIQGSFYNCGFKPQSSPQGYNGAFYGTTYFTGTTELAQEAGGYSVPRVTFKASSYLAPRNIAEENRPVNATVRVWRLTAY